MAIVILAVIAMNDRMTDKTLPLHLLGDEKVKSIQWKITPSDFEKTTLSKDETEECVRLLNGLAFSEKIDENRKYGAALQLDILLENGEKRVISIFEGELTADDGITKTMTAESEERVTDFTDRLVSESLEI